MYSKSGGKNGNHAAVTEASNVSALSYLGLQVYENDYENQFTSIAESTSPFQTKQFALIPAIQVMSALAGSASIADIHSKIVVLCPNDMELFLRLKGSIGKIRSAVKKFNSRKKVGAGSDDEVELEAWKFIVVDILRILIGARGAQNTKNTQKSEFFDLVAISRQIFGLGR